MFSPDKNGPNENETSLFSVKPLTKESSEKIDMSDKLKVRMCYALSYVACFAITIWYKSWSVAGNAFTVHVFKFKFDWTPEETILYNTIITGAGNVGLTIGGFAAAPLLKMGRRKAFLIAQLFAIAGASISMACNVPCLTIGRILVGVAGGISNVCYSKFIFESMPISLASIFGVCLNASL